MQTLHIEVSDEICLSFKETPTEFSYRLRLAAAVKLYELGKLSSGRAAELAGMSRVSFLQTLANYGVPMFQLTEAELQQDSENA